MAAKLTKKEKLLESIQKTKDVAYYQVKITCACGAEFDAGSTKDAIRVDICSKCHPFFTGEQRIVDTEGRVEKYRKRYNLPLPKK